MNEFLKTINNFLSHLPEKDVILIICGDFIRFHQVECLCINIMLTTRKPKQNCDLWSLQLFTSLEVSFRRIGHRFLWRSIWLFKFLMSVCWILFIHSSAFQSEISSTGNTSISVRCIFNSSPFLFTRSIQSSIWNMNGCMVTTTNLLSW